jgi:hypothetical protein
MSTVLDLPYRDNFDRHQLWDRFERADLFEHYSICKLKASPSAKRPSSFRCPAPPCKRGSHGMPRSISAPTWPSFFRAPLAGHACIGSFWLCISSVSRSVHLSTARVLLTTLPETRQRAELELDGLILLGPVYMATQGYGSHEVRHTYTRARALCHQFGETPQTLPVLLELFRLESVCAHHATALALGQQCLTLAHRHPDPRLLLEAHGRMGFTLSLLGDLRMDQFPPRLQAWCSMPMVDGRGGGRARVVGARGMEVHGSPPWRSRIYRELSRHHQKGP